MLQRVDHQPTLAIGVRERRKSSQRPPASIGRRRQDPGGCTLPSNELVLLDQALAERQEQRDQPLPDDVAFELFAIEHVLRDLDLSGDEVAAGRVGGGDDGGLDGVYVFLNEDLLDDDSEILVEGFSASGVSVGSRLLLWVVQAKREASFGETTIDLASSSLRRFLELNTTEENLRSLYSDAVVGRMNIFREVWRKIATRHPKLEVRFSYVSRGHTGTVNAKVEQKRFELEQDLQELLPDSIAHVELVGCVELWKISSSHRKYTLELSYQDAAIGDDSHVALVTLGDYLKFITDEEGNIQRHIFDWNVRDYQGKVEVNREISRSLGMYESPDFWWLNNGVTVIASRVSSVGKTYILDDVQIVNGLQTSYSIYSVLSDLEAAHPSFGRRLLVRILTTDDPASRDRVIKATNHQTAVSAASLRATDEIQRKIEAFFLSYSWYYDRRKNYYRNIGKNADRIIGIPLLAQAIMAMGLGRPDTSRARPSSLLKDDTDYGSLFSSGVDLAVYLWLAKAQKAVDAFLSSPEAGTSSEERTNFRFHLAMVAATRLHGQRIHAPAQLTALAKQNRSIENAELSDSLERLREWHTAYVTETNEPADRIAKGSEFVQRLHDELAALQV